MTKPEKLEMEILIKTIKSDIEIRKDLLKYYEAKGKSDKYYFGLECGEKKTIEYMERYLKKLKEIAK